MYFQSKIFQYVIKQFQSNLKRQKGSLKTGVSRKQSTSNFPKNGHFLPPYSTCTYVCESGGKKCTFFGKFDVICFLETPVLIFALLPYYLQNVHKYLRQLSYTSRLFDCTVYFIFYLHFLMFTQNQVYY